MKNPDLDKNLLIRPACMKDAGDINFLRRHPEVLANLMALPSETIAQNEDFLSRQLNSADDHIFVVEIFKEGKGRVIGLCGLHVNKLARARHSAVLGIMIHPDFHGQGIGAKLMSTMMDLADNWLMLKRIELTVFPDNQKAIRLYESFGFISEGIARMAAIRYGKYEDVLNMARIRL